MRWTVNVQKRYDSTTHLQCWSIKQTIKQYTEAWNLVEANREAKIRVIWSYHLKELKLQENEPVGVTWQMVGSAQCTRHDSTVIQTGWNKSKHDLSLKISRSGKLSNVLTSETPSSSVRTDCYSSEWLVSSDVAYQCTVSVMEKNIMLP